jgi:hypothetical protein
MIILAVEGLILSFLEATAQVIFPSQTFLISYVRSSYVIFLYFLAEYSDFFSFLPCFCDILLMYFKNYRKIF